MLARGECKLIFDDQHNGTKDNNKNNEKAVTLDEREAAYRSEDASNFFTFMTVMIIIPYILQRSSDVYQLCQF